MFNKIKKNILQTKRFPEDLLEIVCRVVEPPNQKVAIHCCKSDLAPRQHISISALQKGHWSNGLVVKALDS